MNPYQAYKRNEPSTGWTRIDILLALYDGALERLDKAEVAIKSGSTSTAITLLARTQLIVSELAAGVRLEGNEVTGSNILHLYEFVTDVLRKPDLKAIASARRILTTLREGFVAIQSEANELERSGQLPSADRLQMVHATA
jgi:flagellin-specific chaperone FliS